jgi:predicted Zn finger-like uncharacterized protein
MTITVHCPSCNAAYKLDEAKIGPQGRKLKCAKCATIWVATLPEPPVEAPATPKAEADVETPAHAQALPPLIDDPVFRDDALPELNEADGNDEPAQGEIPERLAVPDLDKLAGWERKRVSRMFRGETLWMLVGGLVVVAGAMAAVGVYWNTLPETPEASQPALAQKTAAQELKIGYGLPPEGIVLKQVRGEVADVSGDAVLNVSGVMTNLKAESVMVPALRLELVGHDDTVRDAWPIAQTSGTLVPRGQRSFSVSLTGPSLAVAKGWRVVFEDAEPAQAKPKP